ncbi:terminase large subunit domain-containing protein [Allosphingosinicella sp.]|jgi:phage terminase large subunit-like protein|uniref:terminase large subunit domain-containing protein n=1 Tax=Allosphingosinicella sp. TaxID=2823234 RepID=UPI002EF3770E
MSPTLTRRRARAILAVLRRMPPDERARVLCRLPEPAIRAIEEEWWWQAHGGQIEPAGADAPGSGPWRVWLIMAGRGFGKTRAGAEWVWARVREFGRARKSGAAGGDGPLRIALVGGSVDEVAKVMIEGESGLIACARAGEEPRWMPSRRTLEFRNGATAFAYSGERPGMLRGPQHHFAWADELAKWRLGEESWPNLLLGLRLGGRPRAVVTTTPSPGPALRALRAMEGVAETNGRTADNPHLAADFRSWMIEAYGGTRLGRQELEGVLLEEAEGALWTREMIETSRQSGTLPREEYRRIVIGVDPPASAGGTCGIVVCGEGGCGTLFVLADHSVAGASPLGWAAKVAGAAEAWGADRVVAEINNGGAMVETTLRSADAALPVRTVSAGRGKVARAEPIAALFESGRAKLAGRFPELEDELCGLVAGGDYRGPGRSPDRADAMVWAMTELSRPEPPPPRIRLL